MNKTAKYIIVTGIMAELASVVTAIISVYKIHLIYENFGYGEMCGIQECLRSMFYDFIQFWPVFLVIAVVTCFVGYVVSFEK